MSRKVEVGKKILIANEEYALKNSRFFAEQKKLCLNMISSPGSGKTTILARTIIELGGKLKIGVIEGDIQTSLDAERIRETKAPAVQIETGGSCHLSASQVSEALDKLETNALDLIFIENVGNLVCPSAFELGENGKVVVLSVAEGDDKPAKYPAIFAKSKVLLINKIDLQEAVGQVDFNTEKVKSDALNLNKDIEIFSISAKTGEGMQNWYDWLANSVRQIRGG
ncbi:MAG: hydrogenase nickel incorporation protein HypB [Sedimentisphaerales bacterium]|nr:hydrogenase nickel incorporation protein HypB [Sedimentisphaerales bacterium]